MAARDNILYHASISSGTAAGTVIPLSFMYGVENVRVGYGTPVLKSVRAVYQGVYSSSTVGIPVEIKNSNWVDPAGLAAVRITSDVAYARNSLSYMYGRNKVLQPNTAFSVNATLPAQSASAGDIYVLFEIEYSDVPGSNPENLAGSPVMKTCTNASVTLAANTPGTIGTFDNLLQGVQYVLSEIYSRGQSESSVMFVLVEGFANQKGLTRIIPTRNYGIAEQIEGSVILTKQTYNIGVICSSAFSAQEVSISMEMLASAN